MYIVAAHMDGHGWGEAAHDDGSGTALVMQLARIFSMPDVQTERTIRFARWNNEETGTNGAGAYVEQRQGLQGQENPAGSGRYPEPRWLGMIQHDMMRFDHGHQRARERARRPRRQRMGSAVAPADGCLHDLFGQGFPSGAERGAADTWSGGELTGAVVR